MAALKQGQKVRWNTPQGETRGEIVERRTSDFQLAGQRFRASPDAPMYVVETDESKKRAAHREDALTPV